jgi:hypothetical protein
MAKKKKPEESPQEKKPGVHEELEGFNIRINEFGEIISSFEVEKLNAFLNEKVEDKKLSDKKEKDEEE